MKLMEPIVDMHNIKMKGMKAWECGRQILMKQGSSGIMDMRNLAIVCIVVANRERSIATSPNSSRENSRGRGHGQALRVYR